MEKLVYVLWRRPAEARERFRDRVLRELAPALAERGAREICAHVVDEAAAELRITRLDPPVDASLSFWLDTALARGPLEARLREVAERLCGYLVTESVPLREPPGASGSEGRSPGLFTVAFLERPESLSYSEWLDRWLGDHTRVALETQSTFSYVQNVVARPLTADAPPWAAIVEEGFPAEAARDPAVFYDAGDSRERLERNRRRLIESCQRFLDLSRIESHPTSRYRLDPALGGSRLGSDP